MEEKDWKLQEEGHLIVEASFIYPVVILTVIMLLFIGLFRIQSQMLFLQVNEVAGIGKEMAVNPKYDKLINVENISSVRDYYKDSNPYRYFKFNFSNENGRLTNLLQERVQKFAILNSAQFTNCKAKISNKILAQEVEVCVEYTLQMPKVFELIGIDRSFTYTSSVVYQGMDPAEFVRNTDLVYDIGTTLAEKFGINKKIENFLQKMKDIKNKIF